MFIIDNTFSEELNKEMKWVIMNSNSDLLSNSISPKITNKVAEVDFITF